MRFSLGLVLLSLASLVIAPRCVPQVPDHARGMNLPIASSKQIAIGGATLQVDFAVGDFDLPAEKIMPWVVRAATAVNTYYGRFPVARARVLIVTVAGRHGIVQGTTWPGTDWPQPTGKGMDGALGFTRIRLGQHTTIEDLNEDWTMTHELVHMAFPSLPDEQHWMEEGLATYIEPIARVQAGELDAKQVWHDMLEGMPKGEPQPGDQGMDNTHTWGRTYWGGALFCLVADVNIRKQTHNQKGLQDALRAIVKSGGTIDHEWSLSKALAMGDKATGTTVLEELYKQDRGAPAPVDLNQLWKDLGVQQEGGSVVFDSGAPLAKIRDGIM